jgi:hypothetical protein
LAVATRFLHNLSARQSALVVEQLAVIGGGMELFEPAAQSLPRIRDALPNLQRWEVTFVAITMILEIDYL